MNKFEIGMEKLNYGYSKIAGEPAPSAIVDIISLVNRMVEEAYQKGLSEAQLEPSDFLFPVKEISA